MPDKRAKYKVKDIDGYSVRWFETMADVVKFNNGTNLQEYKNDLDLLLSAINMQLNQKAETATYTATISTTWTGENAPYYQSISVSGIEADDNPLVDIVLSDNSETATKEQEEYAKVSDIKTTDGQIMVICLEEKPEVEMKIQLKVVR